MAQVKRSWMFVPGHRQRMVEKASGVAADAVMLDIEDGVPPGEKDRARELIAEALGRERGEEEPARFVRINAIGHPRMEADLEAVLRPGLDGLVLPKVQSVEEVRRVEEVVRGRTGRRGMEGHAPAFLVAIESPRGLLEAPAIASCSERVAGLMLGAEDFGLELGLPTHREAEARELVYARSALVTAAAASHVQSVDGVWPDIQDVDGLWRDARQARRLGFTGKSLIHPSQIEPVNTVFSPAPEEADHALQVIRAFEEATARGTGSISFGGQLIDLPIVERARATLALARELGIVPGQTLNG